MAILADAKHHLVIDQESFQAAFHNQDWVFHGRFLVDCLAFCHSWIAIFYRTKKDIVMTGIPE